MVSVEFNRLSITIRKTETSLIKLQVLKDVNVMTEMVLQEKTQWWCNEIFCVDKDNFDWMSLKDYLKETLDLGRDDVFKVDVKEGFSFFNTSVRAYR
jgi:ATP-dependent RNA helicase DeaD